MLLSKGAAFAAFRGKTLPATVGESANFEHLSFELTDK
jgi:hypothetical protein